MAIVCRGGLEGIAQLQNICAEDFCGLKGLDVDRDKKTPLPSLYPPSGSVGVPAPVSKPPKISTNVPRQ